MSRIRTPDNMEIAALRKKQQTVIDPMVSGAGTPWEDRGTNGTVGAFFKTCSASLSAPGKLFAAIRRPETTNDARGFLMGIAAIWGISAALHVAAYCWHLSQQNVAPSKVEVDMTNCAIYCGVALLVTAAEVFFLFNTLVKIYGRLVAQEKGLPLMPETLIYNVNVYALGPSLMALIPLAGPILAILWIFSDLIIAGSSRLKMNMSASIIDALLSLLAVLGIILVVSFVGYEIMHRFLDIEAITIIAPAKAIYRK